MRSNTVLAVLAAAVLAVSVVLYFVMVGGSGDEAENGIAVEDQSPRIEQKPDETPTQTAIETSGPESQEEAPVSDNAGAEESAVSSDDSESAEPTQPDAPQSASKDPFTVELQEGINEMNDIVGKLLDKFPNSKIAENFADFLIDFGTMLVRYDAGLSRQSLTREERIAKLKQRAEEFGERMGSEMEGFDPTSEDETMEQFLNSNVPIKLTQLLGL